jgi:hypothetical protein
MNIEIYAGRMGFKPDMILSIGRSFIDCHLGERCCFSEWFFAGRIEETATLSHDRFEYAMRLLLLLRVCLWELKIHTFWWFPSRFSYSATRFHRFGPAEAWQLKIQPTCMLGISSILHNVWVTWGETYATTLGFWHTEGQLSGWTLR